MAIKKEQVLNYLFKKEYKPLTFEGIQKALKLYKDEDIQDLYSVLTSLEKEGSLFKTLQGRYSPLRGIGLLVGELQGHFQGYAFLLPEAPGEQDVFIPPERMGGAMHKDRVIVRLLKDLHNGRRREGEVVRILKRGNLNIVGTYQGNRRKGRVLPDDRRLFHEILIPQGSRQAKPGDKLLINITRWPDRFNSLPEGKIIKIIGPAAEPGVDITSIQLKYGLPSSFPVKVLKEAQKYDENHIFTAAREEERLDLRSLPMVTIDDADARDLDDALSLERKKGGYRLGVHIADVSYYVPEGSALDREAAKRATSVYLPDRVIPMLPPQLSNGVCSLNAGSMRLAISVFINLNNEGEIEDYLFSPSIISINERMTYDDLNGILAGDFSIRNKYRALADTFTDMAVLAEKLKNNRIKRGALDFNFPEAKITLDQEGKPVEIHVKLGGRAESIVEEFMLICNEVIATHFFRQKVPFIYRVHEHPDEDKLYILRDFLSIFNLKIKGALNKVSPRQFQEILGEVKGTPVEKIVNYVLLRSLPQARYSDQPIGHFGLATGYYTHFTAPIRRYPDLLVHRILRSSLKGDLTKAEVRKLAKLLPQTAQYCSEQERIAVEAERECADLKKVEYMEGKEGNEYRGTISGVASFGFFVELNNTVEGIVHVTRLADDFYLFDEKSYSLVGERTGKKYRLGDPVRVRLERIDKEMRTIHFSVLDGRKREELHEFGLYS